MTRASVNLRKRFLNVTAVCFTLFLAIEGALIMWYGSYSAQETRQYLDSALQTTQNKLGEMDKRLRMIGSYLTVHPALAKIGKLQASIPVDNDTMQSAFDVMRMSVNASGELSDIVLVNRKGMARSYVSGLGLSLVDQLAGLYDFSRTDADDSQYYFFPEQRIVHDTLFAFTVPLWDVKYDSSLIRYASIQRVGTVMLACRMDAITALMDYGLQHPYTCEVLDWQGGVIARSGSTPHRVDYTQTLSVDSMGVTLRISMEDVHYFDSSFFLPAMLCTGVFFLLTQLLFSRLIHTSILRPIHALTAEMPHIQTTFSTKRLSPLHVDELDVIVASANNMIDALGKASERAVQAKTELIETQMRRNEAELYALQSQINPHFLFNTMQCMRALAVTQGANDVAAIATAMATMLRYAISDGERVRLADEVSIVEKYLYIIDVRYQHSITCTMSFPEDLMQTGCIKMMIQPLVENAVMHGVSYRESGGEIGISACRVGSDMVIEVRDNGRGIESQRLEEINATLQLVFQEAVTHKHIQSFGLYNIHRRIQLAYGSAYGLSLRSVPGDTVLTLKLPCIRPDDDDTEPS